MFHTDLREQYEQARELFAKGRFAEADHLLASVDRRFPNVPDVLYSRARCLGEMGQVAAARVIANKLQNMIGDPRAQELHTWLAMIE